MSASSTVKRTISAGLAAVLVATTLSLTPAIADEKTPENITAAAASTTDAEDVTIQEEADGSITIVDEGQVYSARFDPATGTSTVTSPDGTTATFKVLPGESGIAYRDWSFESISCSLLISAVQLIRSEGGNRAAKTLSKAGLPGKAVAALMWSLGSNAFLDAVSSQC